MMTLKSPSEYFKAYQFQKFGDTIIGWQAKDQILLFQIYHRDILNVRKDILPGKTRQHEVQ